MALTFPTTPADGDTYTLYGVEYTYNAAADKWVGAIITDANTLAAATRAAVRAGVGLDDLIDGDTTTTTPDNDDALVWDGANWVPDSDAWFSNKYDKSVADGLITVSSGSSTAPTSAPDWLNPDETISGTSTWTKPAAITDSTWVWFYGVGGGQGQPRGSTTSGGIGGSAHIIAMLGSQVPATIAFTIGAGGNAGNNIGANPGGNTSATIGSTNLFAQGGVEGGIMEQAGQILAGSTVDENDVVFTAGSTITLALATPPAGFNTVFAGARGSWLPPGYGLDPGVSTYAGDGGWGNQHNLGSQAGQVPGGGGGADQDISSGGRGTAGGAGNVRIYWTTGQ